MLKEPHPGRVKTRLGREIGMTTAAWWFRHQSMRMIRVLDDPRWQLVLAVSPDTEGRCSRIWPGQLPRVAQGPGDLGDRMARIFRSLPPGPVLIIGADIPGITRRHIAHAFATLGRFDAAIGPAPDGGYWLIGLKRSVPPPAGFLEGVRWSSSHTRADSLSTMSNLRVAVIETLQDVDTIADLRLSAR